MQQIYTSLIRELICLIVEVFWINACNYTSLHKRPCPISSRSISVPSFSVLSQFQSRTKKLATCISNILKFLWKNLNIFKSILIHKPTKNLFTHKHYLKDHQIQYPFNSVIDKLNTTVKTSALKCLKLMFTNNNKGP